jgi:hypothetical protein
MCQSRWGHYTCELPAGHAGDHATEGRFTIWSHGADDRVIDIVETPKPLLIETASKGFERDQIVKEGLELGLVLQAGRVTYDVIWTGGGTTRYRYDMNRAIRAADANDLDEQASTIRHLRSEAALARAERRSGARVKRGHVHPSR